MICRVAGCGDSDDIAVRGKAFARREWAKRLRRQIERHRVKPGGPTVGKVPAHASCPSAGCLQLAARDKDFAIWEMRKSTIVVHVQVGEHNLLHIARTDAESA